MTTNKDKAIRYKTTRYIGLTISLLIVFLIARQIEWQGSKTLHTLMEVLATTLALMVGILALIRFYTKKDNVFLFIGAGFLGTAFLDAYHALVTSPLFDIYFPSPPPSLIPWSWVASRLFLSVLMCLSWWTSTLVQSQGREVQTRISERLVFVGVGLATLLSFLFFVFYPLPRAYYPEMFFGRPEELVPALFFLLALVGFLKKGYWKEDAFEDWVVISLIVGFMGQVMFISLSYRLFDTLFDTAHLLKKLSYICMMQGLFISMFHLFKEVEQGKKEIESVVESSPNGMLMISSDGQIKRVNTMVESIFAYKRSELLGQTIEMLMPEAARSMHQQHVSGFLKKPAPRMMGDRMSAMTFLGVRKDGSKVPLDIGLSYIQSEQETFALAVITDISDRKAADEKLASERKSLEKVNLELDSFVYTASHDLRAPLRGITSFSKFLEEDYADRLDDEGRDHLRRIRKGVGRMTQLIDDLLSLSRISRQNNPYEDVHIDQVIASVTERIEFDLKVARVKLVIPKDLPVIHCDRIKVSEVFLNLINNAIKFSQKNNSDGSDGPKVELACSEQNEDYQFSVKDNGIGIDPKYHEKVFGIFQRLHTRGEYEGTGAGLSIVKRVIDDHQGRVWIDSELGKGATFYFTIPKDIEKSDQ